VENDREAWKPLLNLMENTEGEWRWYEAAGLRVSCALLRLELVSSVGSSDGNSERVAASPLGEVDHFLRTSVMGLLGGNLVLNTGEDSELGLNGNVVLMSIVGNLLGEGDILFVWKSGTIDHDGGETEINAALAELERITMVKMEDDLRMLPAKLLGIFYSTLRHVAEEGLVGIVTCALGHLEDDRALQLGGSLDDGLELLHVVEVECRNGIATLDGLCEHLTGVDKTEFLV
jgi:hypothetical protein